MDTPQTPEDAAAEDLARDLSCHHGTPDERTLEHLLTDVHELLRKQAAQDRAIEYLTATVDELAPAARRAAGLLSGGPATRWRRGRMVGDAAAT